MASEGSAVQTVRTAASALRFDADAWLAGLFGHVVFRVTVPDTRAARPFDLLGSLRSIGTRDAFCYTKVPADRPDMVGALVAAGFSVVDVNLTLERPPDHSLAVNGLPCGVRDFTSADIDELLHIAQNCFRYSRFHLDPLIPAGLADVIKREWVHNYARGVRGERLLIAERGGRVVGFLAALAAISDGHTARVIDLVGVDASSQKQGAGRSLVQAFNQQCGPGSDILRVGTQAANVPSLRLYESCGFRMAACAYVLHTHIKGGKVLR
jgi:ribosomal protein S18 acetylase RimI-like enzyme